MRTLKVSEHLSSMELHEKITSIKGYNDVIDWKIIESIKNNPGIEAAEIAKIFCISPQKVYKVIQEYNKKGSNYKQNTQWGGRREETSYLSLKEEEQLLNRLKENAMSGLIITAKDIKKEFEQVIGETVSDDYIWKVFKRHRWSKKAPRPEHPKTDYEQQEDFKKNFMKTWQPPL
jgi:transposase